MGAVRDMDRSGIQDSIRVTEDSAREQRRRVDKGRGHRSSTEERMYNEGRQERTKEEIREHVTSSG